MKLEAHLENLKCVVGDTHWRSFGKNSWRTWEDSCKIYRETNGKLVEIQTPRNFWRNTRRNCLEDACKNFRWNSWRNFWWNSWMNTRKNFWINFRKNFWRNFRRNFDIFQDWFLLLASTFLILDRSSRKQQSYFLDFCSLQRSECSLILMKIEFSFKPVFCENLVYENSLTK